MLILFVCEIVELTVERRAIIGLLHGWGIRMHSRILRFVSQTVKAARKTKRKRRSGIARRYVLIIRVRCVSADDVLRSRKG